MAHSQFTSVAKSAQPMVNFDAAAQEAAAQMLGASFHQRHVGRFHLATKTYDCNAYAANYVVQPRR